MEIPERQKSELNIEPKTCQGAYSSYLDSYITAMPLCHM